MITATKNWFKRHRTTLAVGAGLLGTAYLAGHYVLGKITEARQRMSEDRIARENLKRRFEQNQEDCTYTVLALLPTATDNVTKALPVETILAELQQRKSDKVARSTASSEIAPSEVPSGFDDDAKSTAGASSSGFIRTSQVTEVGAAAEASDAAAVTSAPSPAQALLPTSTKTKVQLWNELKISSITRAFTLIYTLALLTLFTRIQLNLLGRRTYLSSVISLAAPPLESSKISLEDHDDDNLQHEYGSDFETNRKFLTFSWWLLHRGWVDIREKVEAAVKQVFGALTPRDAVSFRQLSELTLEVRKLVEGATEDQRRHQQWLSYLLPPRSEEEFLLRESGIISTSSPASSPSSGGPRDSSKIINASLRRLLDESSDLIESPTFSHVLTLLLDAAFSLLVDTKLAVQAFKMPSAFDPTNPTFFSNINNSNFPAPEQDIPLDLRSASSSSATAPSAPPRIHELSGDDADSDSAAAVFRDWRDATAKLATILAVFTRQAHAIGSSGSGMLSAAEPAGPMGMPLPPQPNLIREANDYLASMDMVRDLEGFAAVVYSSNFEFEGQGVEGYSYDDEPLGNGDDSHSSALGRDHAGDGNGQLPHPARLDDAPVEESIVHVSQDVGRDVAESSWERAWGKASGTDSNV